MQATNPQKLKQNFIIFLYNQTTGRRGCPLQESKCGAGGCRWAKLEKTTGLRGRLLG